jgi:hypothetical protein
MVSCTEYSECPEGVSVRRLVVLQDRAILRSFSQQ